MSKWTEIPHLKADDEDNWKPGKPGWYSVQGYSADGKLEPRKPHIRCNCGTITGIGLHHVHADGTVTESFHHKRGNVYPEDKDGCEWHVWLKLLDYDGGDFPPKNS